jgi:hypothetical protein
LEPVSVFSVFPVEKVHSRFSQEFNGNADMNIDMNIDPTPFQEEPDFAAPSPVPHGSLSSHSSSRVRLTFCQVLPSTIHNHPPFTSSASHILKIHSQQAK